MTKLSPADRAALYGTRRKNDGEDQFQITLVEHLARRARKGVVWYMIRNHGKRSVAAHAKDKKMGLRKGAGDMGFVIPPHGQAAFLELKYGRNGTTVDQDIFAEDVQTAGAYYAVAADIDTAIRILQAWKCIK